MFGLLVGVVGAAFGVYSFALPGKISKEALAAGLAAVSGGLIAASLRAMGV